MPTIVDKWWCVTEDRLILEELKRVEEISGYSHGLTVELARLSHRSLQVASQSGREEIDPEM